MKTSTTIKSKGTVLTLANLTEAYSKVKYLTHAYLLHRAQAIRKVHPIARSLLTRLGSADYSRK